MDSLQYPGTPAELNPNVLEALNAIGADGQGRVADSEETVSLTIDTVCFDRKPIGKEIAEITSRLKHPRSVMDFTFERFCNAVRMGITWCGAVFEGGWGDKYFKSQRLFAIDVDNKVDILNEYGEQMLDFDGSVRKRNLEDCEAHFLDPLHALERAYLYDLNPVCLYFSKSATLESPRFRLVFDAGEPVTDANEAKAVQKFLMGKYLECDQACKNLNRLWFGSNGEVWEAWRVKKEVN